uniref:prepilin-type N-terminal cleavage/methylation domain-containing protein n=1 Tax=Candidatus Scatousia sp. TaxID=3085663 RepID=UPI0040293B7B
MGKEKWGFTLAEVLITLGIIGIIAAITLPALVANYRHKEATARLKKFNTTMGQVLILSENENGAVNTWDMSLKPEDFVRKYFAPYIKTLDIDSVDEGRAYGRIYFLDGSTVIISKGRCMDIVFDINGDRKPNKEGYDQFRFLACDKTITEWCSKKGWCAYYRSDMNQSRAARLNQCKINSAFCSALLEYDNWEFKKDYPYKL